MLKVFYNEAIMFLDVFSDNNVTIVTNDKGYIETYIYLYYIY